MPKLEIAGRARLKQKMIVAAEDKGVRKPGFEREAQSFVQKICVLTPEVRVRPRQALHFEAIDPIRNVTDDPRLCSGDVIRPKRAHGEA